MSHVGKADGYEWMPLSPGPLEPGKKLLLYGKGQQSVAFLAVVRIGGESGPAPKVKPIQTSGYAQNSGHSAQWAELDGFEVTDEARRLWEPSPKQADWDRAERSAQYAGIADVLILLREGDKLVEHGTEGFSGYFGK